MLKTRNKLFAAGAMLMVSVIMLSTASFAWFTISTNPEISTLTTQVAVNQNLEIALAKTAVSNAVPAPTYSAANTSAADKVYTWGSLLNMTDLGTAYSTDVNKTLRPLTLTTGTPNKFQYPTYGTDGRISGLGNLAATAQTKGFGNLVNGDQIYGYYVDFWVQTNVDGDLIVQKTAANRENDTTPTTATGSGSIFTATTGTDAQKAAIAKAMRIAFQDLGSAPTGAAIADTATVTATAASTTYVDNAATISFGGGTSEKVTALTANTPKLIRMYVYLEGADVTNAAASTTALALAGELKVQFSHSSALTPMVP